MALIAETGGFQGLIAPKPSIPTKTHVRKAHPWDVE